MDGCIGRRVFRHKNLYQMANSYVTDLYEVALKAHLSGDLTLACKNYTKYLGFNQSDTTARYNLALVFLTQGDFENGIKELDVLINQTPQNPEVWFSYGRCLTEQGSPEAAKEYYERVLALNSAHIAASLELGACYLALKNLNKARDILDKALTYAPKSFEVHSNLGLINYKLADVDTAF